MGKYWVSVSIPLTGSARRLGGGRLQGCDGFKSPSLARIVARLHQPLRHQLPSSSIVDEFNTSFSVNLNFFQNIELIKNDIYFNEFSFKTKPTTCVLSR